MVNTYASAQPLATNGFIGLENRGASHAVDFRGIEIKDGVAPDASTSEVPVHYEFEEQAGGTAANTGTDASVGAATLVGATGWAPDGVHGGALDLPGGPNANTADLPDNLLQGASDFTTSFWVRPDTMGNWINLFHIGDGLGNAGSFFQIQMRTENGDRGIAATFKAKGSNLQERVQAPDEVDVVAGRWNHVVFTRSGASGTLYLDGEVVASSNDLTIDMGDVGPTANNWLGRNGYVDDPSFDGLMDDVRLYEAALSADEVSAIHAEGTALRTEVALTVDPASPSVVDEPVTVSATVSDENDDAAEGQASLWVDGALVGDPVEVSEGAVAFPALALARGSHQVQVRFAGDAGWRDSRATTTHVVRRPVDDPDAPIHYTFNEGSGSTAANYGTDTTVGPATLVGATTWAEGRYDDGVSLPGGPAGPVTGSSHVELPDDITAGMDEEITVSTWIKPTTLPSWTTHVQLGKSTQEFFLLQSSVINGDRGFAATLRVDDGEQYRIMLPGDSDLPLGEWTHVVVTLGPSPTGGGTTGRIYLDGVLVDAATRHNIPVDIGDVGEGGTTANFIGNTSWNDPRPGGTVDDFRLYGYELSAEEVATLHAAEPPNAAPVAVADSYSTGADQVLTVDAPGVLGNDTDPDWNDVTATGLTQPAHGTVDLAGDGSFAYTPSDGFAGTDTFTYRASDGVAGSEPTTVTIRVNAAPVAEPDAFDAVEGAPLVLAAPGVLGNDSDADGQELTAVDATPPAHGTLELAEDGSLVYTPRAGFSGTDLFTYRASDGEDLSAPATVVVTVSPATGGEPGLPDDGLTTTALAGAALPVTYGASGAVSLTLSPQSATGLVEVRRGGHVLATGAVTGGQAMVLLPQRSLPVGQHALTLHYGGDAKHRASTGEVTVLVEAAPTTTVASRTLVKVRPTRLRWKQDFRVVVQVGSVLGEAGPPTGTVKVRIDGRRVAVGRLDDEGRYVVRIRRNLNVGRHMVAVTYSGDAATEWSRDRQRIRVVR
ncbi:tandem-95 repeat protein [Nocardioides sp. zg-1228]|nr:tandem-95 repeat protein [Nocardioides sp. zg-1228]QSF59433.1 tandem-95 repeat protein [Nocardioides sp. zg-1228]